MTATAMVRSEVFSKDDQAIIAIRDGALWSVPLGGGAEPAKLAHSPAGVTELIGSGADGIVTFVAGKVGLFKLDSGERQGEPAVSHDQKLVVYIRGRTPI